MPFKVYRDLVIQFEDDKGQQGEVKTKTDVPLKVIFRVQEAMQNQGAPDFDGAIQAFADAALTGWNLTEEDGSPIPATAESMMKLPMGLQAAILTAWAKEVSAVPAPLAGPSANGKPPKEQESKSPGS